MPIASFGFTDRISTIVDRAKRDDRHEPVPPGALVLSEPWKIHAVQGIMSSRYHSRTRLSRAVPTPCVLEAPGSDASATISPVPTSIVDKTLGEYHILDLIQVLPFQSIYKAIDSEGRRVTIHASFLRSKQLVDEFNNRCNVLQALHRQFGLFRHWEQFFTRSLSTSIQAVDVPLMEDSSTIKVWFFATAWSSALPAREADHVSSHNAFSAMHILHHVGFAHSGESRHIWVRRDGTVVLPVMHAFSSYSDDGGARNMGMVARLTGTDLPSEVPPSLVLSHVLRHQDNKASARDAEGGSGAEGGSDAEEDSGAEETNFERAQRLTKSLESGDIVDISGVSTDILTTQVYNGWDVIDYIMAYGTLPLAMAALNRLNKEQIVDSYWDSATDLLNFSTLSALVAVEPEYLPKIKPRIERIQNGIRYIQDVKRKALVRRQLDILRGFIDLQQRLKSVATFG
jgi:hypothetical protein